MAVGIIAARANSEMDARLTAFPYVQMHVGEPGAGGTSNVAAETSRQLATMAASSGGASANSAALTWTAVTATETWTRCSFWSASSGGTCGMTGTVTNGAVESGGNAVIEVGNLTVSQPIAS